MSKELIKADFPTALTKEQRAVQDKLMVYLNQEPDPSWVAVHPFIKNYKYIPIERVEYLLKTIFNNNYKIEILSKGQLLNTIEVTVRVHYKDIVTGEWMYHDGTGAQEIQTVKDSGSLKLDLSNINRGAITMALPIAKTIAIKDACDHFGKIFGSDLNRKLQIQYSENLTLIDFNESHPNWNKAVEALKNKAVTIEQIASKYVLTDEIKTKLESYV